MAPKKRQNKRGKRQRRQRKKRPRKTAAVTKKKVKKMIDVALDRRIEDKYLLESAYTALRAGDADNDATNFCYLQEITPGFSAGTAVNARIGEKVFWKGFKLMMRMRPIQYENGAAVSVSNSTNVVPITDSVKVWIISAPRDVTIAPSDLLVKFRRQGQWKQDVITTRKDDFPELKYVRKITKKPIKLRRKFRTISGYPVTGAGVDRAFLFSVPQMVYRDLFVPIKKKILLDNASGYPLKSKYYMFIQYGIGAWRTGYDTNTATMPEIDFRTCHIYEDA